MPQQYTGKEASSTWLIYSVHFSTGKERKSTNHLYPKRKSSWIFQQQNTFSRRTSISLRSIYTEKISRKYSTENSVSKQEREKQQKEPFDVAKSAFCSIPPRSWKIIQDTSRRCWPYHKLQTDGIGWHIVNERKTNKEKI